MTKYSDELLTELREVADIHRSLAIIESPSQHIADADLYDEAADYITKLLDSEIVRKARKHRLRLIE